MEVTDLLPEGLEFLEANQGGRHAAGRVSWALGTLAPGQSRLLRLRDAVACAYVPEQLDNYGHQQSGRPPGSKHFQSSWSVD